MQKSREKWNKFKCNNARHLQGFPVDYTTIKVHVPFAFFSVLPFFQFTRSNIHHSTYEFQPLSALFYPFFSFFLTFLFYFGKFHKGGTEQFSSGNRAVFRAVREVIHFDWFRMFKHALTGQLGALINSEQSQSSSRAVSERFLECIDFLLNQVQMFKNGSSNWFTDHLKKCYVLKYESEFKQTPNGHYAGRLGAVWEQFGSSLGAVWERFQLRIDSDHTRVTYGRHVWIPAQNKQMKYAKQKLSGPPVSLASQPSQIVYKFVFRLRRAVFLK